MTWALRNTTTKWNGWRLVHTKNSSWPTDSLTTWLTDYLTNWNWLSHYLTRWLTEYLSSWLTDKLKNWLTDFLPKGRTLKLIKWLIDQLANRQPDQLTNWLTDYRSIYFICRRLFRHPNLQKCSKTLVFCAFWLGRMLRATTACIFRTSAPPKMVRDC